MLDNANNILSKAREGRYGVGSFNTSDPKVMEAILKAADDLKSPVIVETSEGEVNFSGAKVMVAAFLELAEKVSIPCVLHLDHGKNFELIERVIRAGYRSVHFDGSKLPFSENVSTTKRVVATARPLGIFVEAELGHVPGVSVLHSGSIQEVVGDLQKTDPKEASEFYELTKVDCLATSVGNVHGIYSNKKPIDFDLIEKIRKSVPCFLSLHGSSGVSADDLKRAIELGMTKINFNTELRQAYLSTLKKQLDIDPNEIRPYEVFPPALLAVENVVREKIMAVGSNGKD